MKNPGYVHLQRSAFHGGRPCHARYVLDFIIQLLPNSRRSLGDYRQIFDERHFVIWLLIHGR
jgi:hypothetical protein